MMPLKLFDEHIEQRQEVTGRAAVLSACKLYRYVLYRDVPPLPQDGTPRRAAALIGLNPSRADGFEDDATIRKCIGFCSRWDITRFFMLNLFAYRATKPRDMKLALDPVGEKNLAYLRAFTDRSDLVVCCWGASVDGWVSNAEIARFAAGVRGELKCLGMTASGQPRHPLMLPYTTQLENYSLSS